MSTWQMSPKRTNVSITILCPERKIVLMAATARCHCVIKDQVVVMWPEFKVKGDYR